MAKIELVLGFKKQRLHNKNLFSGKIGEQKGERKIKILRRVHSTQDFCGAGGVRTLVQTRNICAFYMLILA